MGESEPLDKNVKAAEIALKAEKTQVDAEKQQARERTAVDQKAAAELNVERESVAKQMTPAIYQRYEKVRKARRGVAVAEAIDGRCSVCNMGLRPQFFQELKRGDQVMSCESCLRMLYYNPPVTVEDLGIPAAGD
jgi:predicted  nucleic acid-binding Zn-ribbon protein